MTIKELREEKGLSQGKFADSIGIGRTAIVGYEKGKFKPSAEVAAKIKEVYGITVDEAASAALAPVEEEKKPTKRGKKKAEAATAAPAKEPKPTKRGKKKEAAPVAEEQAAPTKRGGRKKAAPAPATEQPAPATAEETNIAAAIKALRTGRGLSQKAFAESIGLKTNTVSAYEQGRIKPSEAALAKIQEVYGTLEVAPAAETAPVVEESKPVAKTRMKRGKKKDEQPAVEKKATKPTKRGTKAEVAPAAEEKKTTKRGKKAAPTVVIQSPMGGSITPEEIIKKTGPVDAVYVRVDENKAYWVKGEETGAVDLW